MDFFRQLFVRRYYHSSYQSAKPKDSEDEIIDPIRSDEKKRFKEVDLERSDSDSGPYFIPDSDEAARELLIGSSEIQSRLRRLHLEKEGREAEDWTEPEIDSFPSHLAALGQGQMERRLLMEVWGIIAGSLSMLQSIYFLQYFLTREEKIL